MFFTPTSYELHDKVQEKQVALEMPVCRAAYLMMQGSEHGGSYCFVRGIRKIPGKSAICRDWILLFCKYTTICTDAEENLKYMQLRHAGKED